MPELLNKAIAIAKKAHEGQVDKGGNPYIGHFLRVMNQGKNDEEKIVGVLHDAVEDLDLTLMDLTRITNITEKNRARIKKYKINMVKLQDRLSESKL